MSPNALNVIVKRYSTNNRVSFDDFVACCVRLKALTGLYGLLNIIVSRRREFLKSTPSAQHCAFTVNIDIHISAQNLQEWIKRSLPRSRFLGCHATLLLGERCVTAQKTAARETRSNVAHTKFPQGRPCSCEWDHAQAVSDDHLA